MKKLMFMLTFLLASTAQAATSVSGTASAVWANPSTSSNTTGVGTGTFSWGDTVSGSVDNLLTFTPVATGISGLTETPFKIGSLFYQNGTININAPYPTSVDLALTLDFASPDLPAFSTNFTLALKSTINGSDPNASADFVLLPGTFSTTSFTLNGTEYFVKLTGFENVVGDGFLVSSGTELHVREQLGASADLYALITDNPLGTPVTPVPEPSSYAMLIAGLGLVGWLARRRKS